MTPPGKGDLPTVYLKPGELYIGEKPTKVVTVLGSCVSITLFSKRLKVGAICHGVLPKCRSNGKCSPACGEMFKFMDCSFHYMLARFKKIGIPKDDIEVKVFGGADTFASRKESAVGTMNVKKTLELLQEENLRLLAGDVGDSFGRKLIFYTHTGEVYVKRLPKSEVMPAPMAQARQA